jgi:Zn-dependent oligopeptidase
MEEFYPDQTIRDKCHEISNKLNKYLIEQSMDKKLYMQFKKYYDNVYPKEKNNNLLTEQMIRYVEKTNLSYKLNGMELNDDDLAKLIEINKRISELSNQISHNISSYDIKFEFIEDELSGMTKQWLETRKTDKQIDFRDVYSLNLKYPDYVPIMSNCSNRNTRRKMNTSYLQRCVNTNPQLINEILELKNTKARILGFEKYSDLKLCKQMAKKTSNVMDFLNDLKEKIKPKTESDIRLISEFANKDNIHKIEQWDLSYYTKKISESIVNINMESLKQYFPLAKVKSGMFEVYQQLFGYRFTNISNLSKHTFWHESVELYQVNKSNDNSLVGYFYLDLFPRSGKFSHAAVFPIIRKSAQNYPICIMACNFDPIINLSFSEVETFFHEFGHIMHNMASIATIGSLAGTTCERDFVEAPSQMLEEWCYVDNVLKMLSEPEIPSELIAKLRLYRKQFVGIHIAKQLTYALTDMALHGSAYNSDPAQIYNQIFEEMLGLNTIPNTNMIASFGHIFGGYDAGYYGYLWSEVYAKDMFYSKFLNNELNPDIGSEYVSKVLCWGSIRDSDISLKEFLSREVSTQPFIDSIL